ncbi:MAG: 3-hydroxyacyl-CoA dehydrogenase family protein [Planctomycetaceae bacterium]
MSVVENPVRTVGIVGAGAMGRGIADVCLRAGLQVRLRDVNAAVACETVLALQQQTAHPEFADRIAVARDDAGLADAELLIEAVPEKLELKKAILEQLEAVLPDSAVLASNSSSLSITELSTALKVPQRFCGLHFCHPVSERPLVEVIGARLTSQDTLNQAFAFATLLGMAPVIVPDSPGFLLNRLIVPYLNEALELLLDGADVESLDRAAKEFGMSRGPLVLFDDFGVDVALAVGRSLYMAFPDRISPSEMLIAMYKSRRLGRKSGGGFYADQAAANAGRVDPEVVRLIHERRRTDVRLPDDQVAQRLFLPMLLEATRTLHDGLASSAAVIDHALQNGLGMSVRYRGLFGWANTVGPNMLLQWLQSLQNIGPRFEPTDMLRHAVESGQPLGAG